uniref:BRCT domain-containing protein n=1 Tax=Lotharella oceanica TaxID=641309 RepID=A0A7S2U2A2_9EUKA
MIEACRLSKKGAKLLVLADKTRTTKKFLFSLSRGLAPLKPGWLQECRRLGEVADAIPYTIPFGVPLFREPPLPPPMNWMDLLNRDGVESIPRGERVLHGLEIGLVSESKNFADNVSAVIEEAGATVVKASKSSMAQNLYCVVCEKTVKRLPRAYPCEVVEFAWIVECLQTQKKVPFAKKGYYNFTHF